MANMIPQANRLYHVGNVGELKQALADLEDHTPVTFRRANVLKIQARVTARVLPGKWRRDRITYTEDGSCENPILVVG